MADNSDPRPAARFPLWIIAISLLIIAACLVLDLVERQLDRNVDELTQAPTAPSRPAAQKPRRPAMTRISQRRATADSAESDEAIADAKNELSPATNPEKDSSMEVATHSGHGGFAPFSGAGGSNAVGEIVGKVLLRGRPPPEQRIDLSRDPICARAHPQPLMTRFFVVSSNGGLADVVVSLSSTKTQFRAPTNKVTLQFTNCQIEPYVSAVMVGQPVRIEITDNTIHIVTVTTRSNGGQPQEKRLRNRPESGSQVEIPNGPGLITVQCLNHPWESAYVEVLDSPYFAVTDSNGEFRIPDVPTGNHVLAAVHQKATGTNSITRPVSVLAGQISAANFTINAPGR